MTKRGRRKLAIGLLLLAACVGVGGAASEFIGVEWWSSVNVKKLRQRFVIVARSQVYVGTRGTAGFFSRGIPMEGARLVKPDRFGPEPWYYRLMPRWYSVNQTDGISVPFAIPLVVFGGLGVWGLAVHRKRGRDRCKECGYEVGALAVCPECGTSVESGEAV